MLSYRFALMLEDVSGSTTAATLFLDTVSRIAAVTDTFLSTANSHRKSPASLDIQGNIRNGVRNVTRDLSIWDLYESGKAYRSSLEEAASLSEAGEKLIKELHQLVDKFLERYQLYISRQDYETALDLLLVSNDLASQFKGLRSASILAQALLSPLSDPANGSEIELVTYREFRDPRDLVAVIVSVSSVYAVLAGFFNTHDAEQPLQVQKIESGSLLLRLKGHSKTVRAMVDVCKSAFAYGLANHTLSGRLADVPKAAEGIEKVVNLREVLARQGVDVSGLDSEIVRSSVDLAKHLSSLVAQMGNIGVNGEFFDVRNKLSATVADQNTNSALPLLRPSAEDDSPIDERKAGYDDGTEQ